MSNINSGQEVDGEDIAPASVDTDQQLVKNDFTRDKRWANLTLDGTQSVPSSTEEKFNWTTNDDDYNAWSTDTYTVNIPSFGPSDRLYMFCGQLYFTGLSADDWVQVNLFQNGSRKATMAKADTGGGTGLVVPFVRYNEAVDQDTFGIGGRASSSGISVDAAESKAYIVRLM